MRIAIIYESQTGNTKLIAEAIKSVAEKNNKVIFKTAEKALETGEDMEVDLYFLGSWTNKGSCADLIRKFSKTLINKKVALFGTAGFSGSKTYYKNLAKSFSKELDMSNNIIGHFYSQGKMPIAIKRNYLELLKKNPSDKNLKIGIMNYDMAKSHPDEKDLKEAKLFAVNMINN